MNQIPNTVNTNELIALLAKAKQTDRILTPDELLEFSTELINQTEEIIIAMANSQFTVPDPRRHAYFNSARRAYKAAVRNLKACIRT